MNYHVYKFGGSCFSDRETLNKVVRIIDDADKVYITVSASYGITKQIREFVTTVKNIDEVKQFSDKLFMHHRALNDNSDCLNELREVLSKFERISNGMLFSGRRSAMELNMLLTFGERLMVIVLKYSLGSEAVILYPEEFIITNTNTINASVNLHKTTHLFNNLNISSEKVIVPGFYGVNSDKVYTLGRSGTDYTGAVLANLINAVSYTIWKDVDGFMSGDPRIISNAHTLNLLSYDEARELSYFGATLLHDKTIDMLIKKKIPLYIKNLHAPEKYTLIKDESDCGYKSLSFLRSISMIQIMDPEISEHTDRISKLTSLLEKNQIKIISINSSFTTISVLVASEYLKLITGVLKDFEYKVTKDLSMIAIVGDHDDPIISSVINKLDKIRIVQLISGINPRLMYLVIDEYNFDITSQLIHELLV